MTVRSERPRVLLQQNTVAHYRSALYSALSRNQRIDFRFLGDTETDTPWMEVINFEEADFCVQRARVYQFKVPRLPALHFQPRALWELLCGRYRVVIALGSPYSLTTWGILLLAPLSRTKVLLWTHGLIRDESGLRWWIRSLQYRLAKGLLLYGDRAVELLLRKGFSSSVLHVVYNSLDPSAQKREAEKVAGVSVEEVRRDLGLGNAQRVVIFTGRLEPRKRLDLFIQAVGALRRKGRGVHGLLVGKGSHERALRHLVRKENIEDCIHFTGPCHDESRLAVYFRAADLCVIPSGAGLTVMHAIGYGTPVLTHDRPEAQFPEVEAVIPGTTGLLFRRGDLHDLAVQMEQALYPMPLKERMGDGAERILFQRYHPERQAERMARACERAMGRA